MKELPSCLNVSIAVLKAELEKLEAMSELVISGGFAALDFPVSELDIFVKTSKALLNNNIKTIGDLIFKSRKELLKIRGFGKKDLAMVEDCLCGKYGLTVPYWK